jgi:hypothetical protein
MLARADERRLNDFDGRGYLSERRQGAISRTCFRRVRTETAVTVSLRVELD